MLRYLMLRLAHSERFNKFIRTSRLARPLLNRFIAGENVQDAIFAVRDLNRKGILGIINYIGENVLDVKGAQNATSVYLNVLDEIKKNGIKSSISLKLTQLGLDIDENICIKNLEKILQRAAKYNNFVCIDMEGSAYTTRTINIYKKIRQKYKNVGIAIQANMRRSEFDILELIPLGLNVRLCKGAYKEPPEVAWQKKKNVDINFIHLAKISFPRAHVAVATHDEKIIRWTKRYTNKTGIKKDEFEFQFLYGIRSDLQKRLAAEGYFVKVFIPFGRDCVPYLMRRLAERPANLVFILKNLFR